MKRPFFVTGISLFSAFFLASFLDNIALLISIIISGFIAFVLTFFVRNKTAALVSICVFLALLEFTALNYFSYQPITELDGQKLTVNATVTEDRTSSGKRFYYTVVADGNSGALHEGTKFILSTPDTVDLDAFDTFSAGVSFYLPSDSGDFNAREYYKSKGIYILGYIGSDVKYTGVSENYKFDRFCYFIRTFVKESFYDNMSRDNAALMTAVIQGDKSSLKDEVYDAFKWCGVSHIAVVSGLHIAIVMSLFLFVFQRLTVNRRLAYVITCIPVIGFIIISGFTPSSLRSGIMCLIYLISQATLKKGDGLNSLGFAAAIMLALNPFQIRNLSFLLSFSATLGIVLIGNKYAGWKIFSGDKHRFFKNRLHNLCGILSQTVSAILFTLPVSIFVFGYISLVSPIVNLLILPFMPLLMAFGMLGVCFNALHFVWGTKACLTVASLFAGYIKRVVLFFGKKDSVLLSLDGSAIKIWLIISAVMIFVAACYKKKHLIYAVASVVSLLFAVAIWIPVIYLANYTTVSVLPADNGICMVISDYDGSYIVGCGGDYDTYYKCNSKLTEDINNKVLGFVLPRNDNTFGRNAAEVIENNHIDTLMLSNYGDKVEYNWLNKTQLSVGIEQSVYGDKSFYLYETEQFSALKITVSGVVIVVAGDNTDFSLLPDDFKQCDIIVCSKTVPLGLNSCTAETAVISADKKRSVAVKTSLNLSGVEAYLTADGEIDIVISNDGKVTYRNK